MSDDAPLTREINYTLATVCFGLVHCGPIILHNCPQPQMTDLQTKQQAKRSNATKKKNNNVKVRTLSKLILGMRQFFLGILALSQ